VLIGLVLAALICTPALAEEDDTAEVQLKAKVLPPPCRVITLFACDVDCTRANLWGLLVCCNPPSAITVGFGWDIVSHRDEPGSYPNWTLGKKLCFGLFQGPVSGLSPNTTYYYRARAQVGSYIAYGEELIFTTPPDIQVITLPAKNIGKKQATLGGRTIGPYRWSLVKVSFGWDTRSHAGDAGGYSHWTTWQKVWVGDSFYANITNLKPNTTYYFRVRMERNGVISYGQELSFKTSR
jgi:hypothetical protein